MLRELGVTNEDMHVCEGLGMTGMSRASRGLRHGAGVQLLEAALAVDFRHLVFDGRVGARHGGRRERRGDEAASQRPRITVTP